MNNKIDCNKLNKLYLIMLSAFFLVSIVNIFTNRVIVEVKIDKMEKRYSFCKNTIQHRQYIQLTKKAEEVSEYFRQKLLNDSFHKLSGGY